MPQDKHTNRRILLVSRPHGAPTNDNFRLEIQDKPQPITGQVLLHTRYLSLDPYMRGRMSDAPPVALGGVMVGGVVSTVESSKNPNFEVGDWVLANTGWQDYALSDGHDIKNLGQLISHPSRYLSVLGMPGFTAYMGLIDIGQPKAGETLVVAAASGAVGSIVGQIAKLYGCIVVGIAGGAEKCSYVIEELGFDACLDHHAHDFSQQLKKACIRGIDIYYENVGGKVFDNVLPLLNSRARIPLCGLISQYNSIELPTGPDRLPLLQSIILRKRIRMQGFIIFDDYGHHYGEFMRQMSAWIDQGKIKFREDLVKGLENAPQAFIGLLQGKNFGKLVVQVSDD